VQGTVPADLLPGEPELHRLLGYPDDRTGDMQLICELGARGFEIPDQSAAFDFATADARLCSERWRLFAQLDIGHAVEGVNWRRVYFWIDQDELDWGQFACV
jgi:hypothetical protein